MKVFEIILGLVITVYAIKFMISLCKPIRFDLESIGFMICFIGMIVLYCLYS